MFDGVSLNTLWELVSWPQDRCAENKTSMVIKNIQQKPSE